MNKKLEFGYCHGCIYFKRENLFDAYCRRNPPTQLNDPVVVHKMIFGFPKTSPNDWCGEYKSRIEEENNNLR